MTNNKAIAGRCRRALVAAAIAAVFTSASGSPLATQAAAPTTPAATTVDGGQYYGQLLDGKLHGQGKIVWPNGAWYEGGFDKGLFSGKGKYQASTGATYEGDFKDGVMTGQGRTVDQHGAVYVGHFANNEFDGKGRYELPDKQSYEGDFVKGDFTGNGVYQDKDGSRLAGAFVKWHVQGVATFTGTKGDILEGSFVDNELVGKGRFIGKNGSRYEGEFKNSKFNGQGVFRDAKGNEYKGGFEYGLYEGEGVLTYAVPQTDGRTKDSGTWHYGQLENKEAEKQTKLNVETALYNQRALLDKTLSALLPHEAGKINLYLLAVGGNGAQEVFHRETDFVRKQFDSDFGTQGRSMVLVNSRNTVSEAPMATLTSIRESLTAIANRMDKENDILFLYLTSHGSKDHEFQLDQNGMDLRNLEAKELGKMLKESGIRWKVVVVSACYSGGFIDPLKDEHTMVITAARHDRTSFGCADENDFTYFGKAFFKESLPHSTSFGDAFNKTKTLVATWEKDDAKADGETSEIVHSEPQMHHAAAIDKYLKKWRAQLKAAPQAVDVKQTLPVGPVEQKSTQ
ncbi:C13 family peptidase [Paraherbaspirillum soli]|uniref:C13 family peptidase n=1 Tax=Paraherbaspirillum soli TaxID=631222 RepID=A0ABW0M9R6_9BURK